MPIPTTVASVARLFPWLSSAVPGGVELPRVTWEARHGWIVRLLWFHVGLIALLSAVADGSFLDRFVPCVPLFVLAVLATREWLTPRLRSSAAGLGLMTSSALIVHLSGGLTEMHFHFFVMLGVISLYQDWRPFLLSIGFVAVHHAGVGVVAPEKVFNNPDAWRAPLQWAAIHAFFVLCASAVSVASWRILEDSNRKARADLEASERRFRSLIEHSTDVVTVVDPSGVIAYDSPSSERLLGYSLAERVGSNGLDLVHPDDLPRVSEVLERVLAEGGTAAHVELRVRHRDGSYLWVDASLTNLLDEPSVGAIVTNFRDISEHKSLEDELAHQAFHDSLTGLANRALLLDRVEHARETARSRGGSPLALLFLDLDDFKTVNDALGHAAGDTILRATAGRIATVLRPGDTASRLGGDEFAVLLEQLSDPVEAYDVGARLLEAVCTPLDVDGTLIAVNASLGIVVSDGDEDANALLRNADLAMYRAKGEGKGRFEIYEAGMHAAVVERLALKADLRRATEAGEFVPHYQPIVDLATGETVGVEALARWIHPEHGLVAPAMFIPLAEETGLIVDIGRQVLRQACVDAARWQQELGEGAPRSVSVNLSPRQLAHQDIVADVAAALADSGLPSSALTLEITETVLLEETDSVARTLAAVRALGVCFALDDFGTGYSSLSYLDRFPVDVVKIDKSFIDSLAGNGSSPSPLVDAIVQLGAVLGLGVTAEGIEDADQLVRLQAMGCQTGQGFYFAKPMSAGALRATLTPGTTGAARGVTAVD